MFDSNSSDELEKLIDFSVAIPTYNGESRLPEILEHLRSQIGVEHLKWEVIVVDNNSTDSTAWVIQNYQTSWFVTCPLRSCLESRQGAAFARQRAVREARGELIGFLDDDNLPAPDWVAAAYAFGKEHPQAGAYGGQIHGDYEVKPPEDFERIQTFLAIRECGLEPRLYDPANLSLPPAAAVVIRREAWCKNVPECLVLKGRLGKSMVGGEDLEPLLYIHAAGWEIWYNPTMHTYHQIPHWRLERGYLLALARGCGLSVCQLRLLNAKNWQKPLVMGKTVLGNLRRATRHLLKYRRQVRMSLTVECELEFYLSSMVSPFYVLKQSMQRQFLAMKNLISSL